MSYEPYIRVPTYTIRINGSSPTILQYNAELKQSAIIVTLPMIEEEEEEIFEVDITASPAFGERYPYRSDVSARVFCSLEPFDGDHECDRRLSNTTTSFSFLLTNPTSRVRFIVQEGMSYDDSPQPMLLEEFEMLNMILKENIIPLKERT